MARVRDRIVCLVALLAIGFCSVLAGTLAAADAPRVMLDSGEIEGVSADGLHVFKGIPYAAPPVGDIRWRAPQPVKKWSGVRKTTEYGNDAPQKNPWAANQDEDCLYLNVWASARGVGFQPAESERNREAGSLSHLAPVMVWIHGGGFINGSGRINGEAFVKPGVVFVSFNYRLGRFGFFAHPALDQQRPPNEPPANFWLQDQIAALKWIQRNIAHFGGDPDRVTIFGVSAGGTSVNMLMASPLAKGLFQRAIAQSGIGGFGPYRRWRESHAGREPLTKIGERFAAAQGLDSQANVAAALRALPWKTVAKIGSGSEDREGFDIVVDGVSLTDDPQKVFEQGRQNPVPFIAGFNGFEGNLSLVLPWTDQPPRTEVEKRLDRLGPLYGKQPDDKALWNDLYGDVFFGASTLLLVREMQRVKTPAWTYYFDYVRGRGRNSRGAGHGSEVPFVFGSVMFPGDRDREIIRAMQGHWIQRLEAYPTKLSAESEKALRERVAALFEALRAGDIEKCLGLSDPQVVKSKGRDTAERFFKGVSALVKFAGVQPGDRVVKSITPIDNGQAAKVEIELTLKGKAQPRGYEVWGLIDGKWFYRETSK